MQGVLAELRQEDVGSEMRIHELDRWNHNLSLLAEHMNNRYQQEMESVTESSEQKLATLEEDAERRHIMLTNTMRERMFVLESQVNEMAERANVEQRIATMCDRDRKVHLGKLHSEEEIAWKLQEAAIESDIRWTDAMRRQSFQMHSVESASARAKDAVKRSEDNLRSELDEANKRLRFNNSEEDVLIFARS
jgi:hypothetical protein